MGKIKEKRNIGREILDSIQEIKGGGWRTNQVCAPEDIKYTREKLELSQAGFASILHVSVRTLQAWEQGKRSPSGAAALLTLAATRPDVIREVLI